LGVLGHFPKFSKCPHTKNIIETAFSFEDRSGGTMFFEHMNFQPRASKAQHFYFLQKRPLPLHVTPEQTLQSPFFKVEAGTTQDLRRRTEITPVKHSHTRMKPLALASGHGRYITVTPEREILSVGEWPLHISVINLQPFHFRNGYVTAVSLLKPPPGSRSGLKNPLGLLESSLDIIVFKFNAETTGVVIEIEMCKMPRGSNSKKGDWLVSVVRWVMAVAH
jgi:hypothetical protein